MKLVIGNKNYSSWSLRPWVLLRHLEIPFDEELVKFNVPAEFRARVGKYSGARMVPILVDDDVTIWDSLAIVEYLAEKFPDKHVWPAGRAARAVARSACAEMHAGFATLRATMPMNFQIRFDKILFNGRVRREAARIIDIWRDCRERFGAGGPFLFGRFSAADAYFAPVTQRFVGYGYDVPPVAREYCQTILALPAMRAWIDAAQAETDFFPEDEPYRDSPAG
jgi:glutathione S-transferase